MTEIEKLVERLRTYITERENDTDYCDGTITDMLHEVATALAALKGAEEELKAAVEAANLAASWNALAEVRLERAEKAERERNTATEQFRWAAKQNEANFARAEKAEAERDAALAALAPMVAAFAHVAGEGSCNHPEHIVMLEPRDLKLGDLWNARRAALAALKGAEGGIAALREALQGLEWANEQLCIVRSLAAYDAICADPGGTDALLELDNARRRARAALASNSGDAQSQEGTI